MAARARTFEDGQLGPGGNVLGAAGGPAKPLDQAAAPPARHAKCAGQARCHRRSRAAFAG